MEKPEWERCAESFDQIAGRLGELREEVRQYASSDNFSYCQRMRFARWLGDVAWCTGAAEGSARMLRKMHEEE